MVNPFYKHVITQKGLYFLAKQQMGATPNVTRAVCGSGFAQVEDLELQREVTNPIAEMELGPRELVNNAIIKLSMRITNENKPSAMHIRQIGVYAEDPDEGEILYQLLQYESPQPLPSTDETRGAISYFECQIDLVFANAEGVAIPTSPGWFLNKDDLAEHNQDPEAHEGRFTDLHRQIGEMEKSFNAWQVEQDNRIKLLEDTMYTDISDNKKIVVFTDITSIKLIQGVYNAAAGRLEC